MIDQEFIDISEDYEKYRPKSCASMGFETGLTKNDRFLINKIRSEYLKKLDEIYEN